MGAETKQRGMNSGVPVAMNATCTECGYTSRGGTVMPWIEVRDGKWTVRDDVSFLCRGCDEVADFDVKVTDVAHYE